LKSQLGADEFVPIFLFSIINSNIENLLFICEYLYYFSDLECLKGEDGYILITFFSLINYIENFEEKKE
jgi:hypothetical protein